MAKTPTPRPKRDPAFYRTRCSCGRNLHTQRLFMMRCKTCRVMCARFPGGEKIKPSVPIDWRPNDHPTQ